MLTADDRAAGYWWELSLRQVEVSRTMVFDAPRQARAFFEALIADNLDLGRPEHVEILFKRDPRGRKPKDQAGGVFKTAIDRNNQGVTINAFWRHSRVKQYLKDGRALRVETVVNSPDDLGCARRLHNLPELQARARAVNTRLLHTEKVGQGCVFDSPAWFAPASLEVAMSANCLQVYQKPVPYNRFSHTLSEAYLRSMSEAVPRYTTAPSPSWQSSHHRLPASPS